MPRSLPVLIAALLFCNAFAFATGTDSNVVISSAKEKYYFDYSKKSNTVSVKEEISTSYLCNNFRTSVPFAELYDDKTSIDNLKIYINGSKTRSIEPNFSYYSVQDVFYSDAHVCYFSMPFENKGSTSEVDYEKTLNDPRYFTNIYFSDNVPIQNKTISITVPRWMKVELKEMNFVGHNIIKTSTYNSKNDEDEIVYTIKNLSPKEREDHSPGASYIEPHLLVLCKYADVPEGKIVYCNTLDDQYAWYRSLTKDLGNNTAIIGAKAQEIIKGLSTDIDKIKAVYFWMQGNIRYIAFEDGIAGFRPEKADEVLRKKYGDCKGMAHLTKELLKSLGFDARLCWIGTNHIAYDYSTPSIAVDNHMICGLLYQGKTYFLDATENYIGFNEYAERIQGREVLIEDGDKYIFTHVPATTYQQNLDAEKCNLHINGNDLEGTVSREWKGEEEENIFGQLNAIKREKSDEAFSNYLSRRNKDYQIIDFKTSDLQNYDKPLTVQYNLKHANALSSFGKDIYVDLDYRKDFSEFNFDIKERQNDFWFSYKINTQLEVALTIPDGYAVSSMPPNLTISNADYEFTATLTKQPGKLIYKKSIIIKNPRLSKTKFVQWNSDIEKLKAFYNEQIVLKSS